MSLPPRHRIRVYDALVASEGEWKTARELHAMVLDTGYHLQPSNVANVLAWFWVRGWVERTTAEYTSRTCSSCGHISRDGILQYRISNVNPNPCEFYGTNGAILRTLADGAARTAPEIAQMLHMIRTGVTRQMRSLRRQGLVEIVPSDQPVSQKYPHRWRLTEAASSSKGKDALQDPCASSPRRTVGPRSSAPRSLPRSKGSIGEPSDR